MQKAEAYLAFFALFILKDFMCIMALSPVRWLLIRIDYISLMDSTDDSVKATLWATAEPGTGIVAASVAILRPLFRSIKSGVRDKLSEYGASKSSRTATTTTLDRSQPGRMGEDEGIIPLTLVETLEHRDAQVMKKDRTSTYSILSPTWDMDIEAQQAQVGQVIHVRMMSPPPPTPPLKD